MNSLDVNFSYIVRNLFSKLSLNHMSLSFQEDVYMNYNIKIIVLEYIH